MFAKEILRHPYFNLAQRRIGVTCPAGSASARASIAWDGPGISLKLYPMNKKYRGIGCEISISRSHFFDGGRNALPQQMRFGLRHAIKPPARTICHPKPASQAMQRRCRI
ncbi:MAG: hypothetical protein INR62_09710 [Rhodospirillales bacterium]|nr:hypothetical protein [Acetobacter sp.]